MTNHGKLFIHQKHHIKYGLITKAISLLNFTCNIIPISRPYVGS